MAGQSNAASPGKAGHGGYYDIPCRNKCRSKCRSKAGGRPIDGIGATALNSAAPVALTRPYPSRRFSHTLLAVSATARPLPVDENGMHVFHHFDSAVQSRAPLPNAASRRAGRGWRSEVAPKAPGRAPHPARAPAWLR